jgi:hypothetical protein
MYYLVNQKHLAPGQAIMGALRCINSFHLQLRYLPSLNQTIGECLAARRSEAQNICLTEMNHQIHPRVIRIRVSDQQASTIDPAQAPWMYTLAILLNSRAPLRAHRKLALLLGPYVEADDPYPDLKRCTGMMQSLLIWRENSHQNALKPNNTGGGPYSAESQRGRSPVAPPSALRNTVNGAGSRRVSWEIKPGKGDGTAKRDNSSASLVIDPAISSSTKLSSGSDSKSSSEYKAVSPIEKGSKGVGKEKGKDGKETRSKLKGEKSVKDLAGALARFWVG